VPYLAIDPMDVGRSYEAIIRVNSQSGKGGVAYLMETEHHLQLPRGLQVDFAQKVQAITDARGGELTAAELMEIFREHYLAHEQPYELVSYVHSSGTEDRLAVRMLVDGEEREVEGVGNGPIAALVDAFDRSFGITIRIRDYHEHAMSADTNATAAAYVSVDVDDETLWGVGLHSSIATASLRAVINGVNRAQAAREALAAATAAFDDFVGSYAGNARCTSERDPLVLRVIGVPRHLWTFPLDAELPCGVRLERVRVFERTTFFDGAQLRLIRRVLLREIIAR